MRRTGGAVLIALGLSGCFLFKAERPSAHPLELIGKDADTVVEVRDISLLVEYRPRLTAQLRPVMGPLDISRLVSELALVLGFDPTTKDGLKSVGLTTSGPIAGEVRNDGTGALWAIPVSDAATFGPVLEAAIKARMDIGQTKSDTRDGVRLTRMTIEFGPHQATAAAYAAAKGHILLGLGPHADALVVAAARRARPDSVRGDDGYRKFVADLGADFDVRMVTRRGGRAIVSAARRVSGRDPAELRRVLDRIDTVGWSMRYAARGFEVVGRARLDDRGEKAVQRIFAVPGKPPSGVLAVDLPQTVAFAQLAADPKALVDLIAPAGSQPRKQLEKSVAGLKNDVDIDVLADVLPHFTGHAAVAIGLDDLTKVDFGTITAQPVRQGWLAAAAAAKDPARLRAAEQKLEGRLKARQLSVRVRKISKTEVRDVVAAPGPAIESQRGPNDAYFSTFTKDEVWGFSFEPKLVADILAGGGKDQLNGRPGAYFVLRFNRLTEQLRRFDDRQLPLLYRPFVLKGLAYLDLFDRIDMRVEPVDGGVGFEGRLHFAAPSAKKP